MSAPILESPGTIPGWSASRIRAHFVEFSDVRKAGRRSATRGLSEAASYVSSRLAAMGLQPIHPKEYRHVTYGPINHVRAVALRSHGPDSLLWVTDLEMAPDPRSRPAHTFLTSFRRVSEGEEIVPAGRGEAAVTDSALSDRFAGQLAQLGFEVVLMPSAPVAGRPGFQADLALVRLSRARLDRLLSTPSNRVEVAVDVDFEPLAGLVHVMGYLPGSEPTARDRLVVVAAPLDSGGYPAGVAVLDPLRTGMPSSALLEVARRLAAEQRIGHGVRKTLLFAWFSGDAQGQLGLKAFLESPPWPASAIDHVVFLGKSALSDDRLLHIPVPARATPEQGLELAKRTHAVLHGLALAPSEHDS